MSLITAKRELAAATHAIVKSSKPTAEHYEFLVAAVAKLYEADTGEKCEVNILVRRPVRYCTMNCGGISGDTRTRKQVMAECEDCENGYQEMRVAG